MSKNNNTSEDVLDEIQYLNKISDQLMSILMNVEKEHFVVQLLSEELEGNYDKKDAAILWIVKSKRISNLTEITYDYANKLIDEVAELVKRINDKVEVLRVKEEM